MAAATVQSVAGQGVVGQQVSCPWLDPLGPYEITQGWGSTNVGSEPAEDRQGKHYSHWHAGVDLSADHMTTRHVVMPAGVLAKAVYLNNPQGYGTALILEVYSSVQTGRGGAVIAQRHVDIFLGHLATRLVANGQMVRGGDRLAVPDSTGNSTGPHLHFEVRPPDGKYGTDFDPSAWLLSGTEFGTNAGAGVLDPLAGIGDAITQAERSVMNTVVGLAQAPLGGSLMLAGGVTIGF